MSFDIEGFSEAVRKSIENSKQEIKEYNIPSKIVIEIGEQTIKEMKLPPQLEEHLLKKNKEWFSEESKKTESDDESSRNIDSSEIRLARLEGKVSMLLSENCRVNQAIERILILLEKMGV